MSYVIYNKETTRYLKNHPGVRTDRSSFDTERSAKVVLTREINNTKSLTIPIVRDAFAIMEVSEFQKIEKKEIVINLMSGKPVEIGVNTPACCNPSCELYWTM